MCPVLASDTTKASKSVPTQSHFGSSWPNWSRTKVSRPCPAGRGYPSVAVPRSTLPFPFLASAGALTKARAVLEKARQKNACCPELWYVRGCVRACVLAGPCHLVHCTATWRPLVANMSELGVLAVWFSLLLHLYLLLDLRIRLGAVQIEVNAGMANIGQALMAKGEPALCQPFALRGTYSSLSSPPQPCRSAPALVFCGQRPFSLRAGRSARPRVSMHSRSVNTTLTCC